MFGCIFSERRRCTFLYVLMCVGWAIVVGWKIILEYRYKKESQDYL